MGKKKSFFQSKGIWLVIILVITTALPNLADLATVLTFFGLNIKDSQKTQHIDNQINIDVGNAMTILIIAVLVLVLILLKMMKKSNPATVVTKDRPAEPTQYFFGRKEIIKKIEEKLEAISKIVLLNGMGGIGKTEICRYLFHKYEKNSLPFIEKIGWVTSRENIETTFYNQFPEIRIKTEVSSDYWHEAKRYINEQGQGLLLMIDNANDISRHDVEDLSKLACKIILTSRSEIDGIDPIEIDRLSKDECRELYRKHSKDKASPDELIDDIIKLAAQHTLSVELLAKTQEAGGITAQKLLEELHRTGFNLAGIPEKIIYLHTDDDKEEYDRFIEHIAKIFDIAKITKIEEQRILQLFSILANEPIPTETVKEWLNLGSLDDLNEDVRKGWISKKNKDGKYNFYMHPVIAEAIRYRKMPSKEEVSTLIRVVADELSLEIGEIFTTKLHIIPHAESLVRKLKDMESEDFARMLHNAARIYYKQGDYAKALEWYEKALKIRENVLGKEHPDTAMTYNNMAVVYADQGDYAKALEWFCKSYRIRFHKLGENHPNTKTTKNNMRTAYNNAGFQEPFDEWLENVLLRGL
ncbi:MAG: tetratricopeptide repeat protein [Syntrophobacterales bacterium]|nr:tetratricopeptide repeat protein [Syntrophobacterales bacterium]